MNLRSFFILLILTFVETSVFASKINLYSARRDKNTSYSYYLNSFKSIKSKEKMPSSFSFSQSIKVLEAQQELSTLNINELTELKSYDELVQIFEVLRNTFWVQDFSLNFYRRISWLYPDDGCYIRAEYGISKIEIQFQNNELTKAKKLFAFGDLRFNTPYNFNGEVNWWYHVALAYKHDNKIYILDPSVDMYEPIQLEKWIAKINRDNDKVRVAICSRFAVTPEDSCLLAQPKDFNQIHKEQIEYLNLEWAQLSLLDLNPNELLKDKPPWLNSEK